MSSPEKPRVRLVVYVSENVYNEINAIALKEDRSISSIAERKILAGLGLEKGKDVPARHSPAQSGTAQLFETTPFKDPLANISEDNLNLLAEKLLHILQPKVASDISVPARSDPVRHVPAQTSTVVKIAMARKEIFQTQDLARRLHEFVVSRGITQRQFKEQYGFDISQITRWIHGKRGMSTEIVQKTKEILGDSA